MLVYIYTANKTQIKHIMKTHYAFYFNQFICYNFKKNVWCLNSVKNVNIGFKAPFIEIFFST